MRTSCAYDIFFLDIQMSEQDGLKLAKQLRKTGGRGVIIFITALAEYVYDSFEVEAFKKFDENENGSLLIQTMNWCKSVKLDDIYYCEVINRKTYLHTKNGVIEYYCLLYAAASCGLFFCQVKVGIGGCLYILLGIILLAVCGTLFQKCRFIEAVSFSSLVISVYSIVDGIILSEMSLLADGIGIIDHGVLLEEESLEELEKKNSRYIHFIVTDTSQASRILEADFHTSNFHIDDDHNLRLYDTEIEVAAITRKWIESGLNISEAHTQNDTLEDYFKRVTGGEGIA